MGEAAILKLTAQVAFIALAVWAASAAMGKKGAANFTVDRTRRPTWGGGTEPVSNAFDYSLVGAPKAQPTSYNPGPIAPQTTY